MNTIPIDSIEYGATYRAIYGTGQEKETGLIMPYPIHGVPNNMLAFQECAEYSVGNGKTRIQCNYGKEELVIMPKINIQFIERIKGAGAAGGVRRRRRITRRRTTRKR